MLGACRRNSAFMYLGVAAKSTDILGLYAAARHGGHGSTTAHEQDRLRVARSVRVFDVVCSSILGRRSGAPVLRPLDPAPGDLMDDGAATTSSSSHRALALRATYESCSILDAIVGRFADEGSLSTTSSEHFLQLLRDWSQALPLALRQRLHDVDDDEDDDLDGDDDIDDTQHEPQHEPQYQETMIANIHVAGTYYFGVILVTRQFLIQHIGPQLRRPLQAAPAAPPLAQACIGAAIYMARMCREAADAHILLGNMIIIKAWVFAAGLVLGFGLLCEDESANGEAREAFQGAQHVLTVLARLSPQAEQYKSILAAFSEAIDTYRRQLRRQHNASSGSVPYVEQILSYDAASASLAPARQPTTPPPALAAADDAAASMLDMWSTPLDNNELMLRILWEGYAMNFDDPLQSVCGVPGAVDLPV